MQQTPGVRMACQRCPYTTGPTAPEAPTNAVCSTTTYSNSEGIYHYRNLAETVSSLQMTVSLSRNPSHLRRQSTSRLRCIHCSGLGDAPLEVVRSLRRLLTLSARRPVGRVRGTTAEGHDNISRRRLVSF